MIREANRAGCAASDQAVVTYLFPSPSLRSVNGKRFETRLPYVPTWRRSDGILNFRVPGGMLTKLPEGACIISFHGQYDPVKSLELDWVRAYWEREATPQHSIDPEEVSHAS